MQLTLTDGWQAAWSTEHRQWYYFNVATGQRQWDAPAGTHGTACPQQQEQQQQCCPHNFTTASAAAGNDESTLPTAAAVPGSTKSARQQQQAAVLHPVAGSSHSSQCLYWYNDPHGRLLGPFTLEQLTAWRAYLPMDLKVFMRTNTSNAVHTEMHETGNHTGGSGSDQYKASGGDGDMDISTAAEECQTAAAAAEEEECQTAAAAEEEEEEEERMTPDVAPAAAAAAVADKQGTTAVVEAAVGSACTTTAAKAAAQVPAEQDVGQHTAGAAAAESNLQPVDSQVAAAAANTGALTDATAETAAAIDDGSNTDHGSTEQGAAAAAAGSTSEGEAAAAAAGGNHNSSSGTDGQASAFVYLAEVMGDMHLLQSWEDAQQQQQQGQQQQQQRHSRPVAPPAPVWESWCARYSSCSCMPQQQQQYAHHAAWQQQQSAGQQSYRTACPQWGHVQQQQQQHAMPYSAGVSSSSKASSGSGFNKYAAAVLQGLPPDDEAVQLARMAAEHGYKLEDVLQQFRPAGGATSGTAAEGILGLSSGGAGGDQGLAAAEQAGVGVVLTKDPRSGRLTYAGRSSSTGSGAATFSENRKMAVELYGDLARWCNPAELEKMLQKAKAKKQRLA